MRETPLCQCSDDTNNLFMHSELWYLPGQLNRKRFMGYAQRMIGCKRDYPYGIRIMGYSSATRIKHNGLRREDRRERERHRELIP